MPDETFDAVVVGGGTKALFLALYLIRYGGMRVGIFERRHEIGGCLSTDEVAAAGFRGNTHANIILPWYYAPLWRDFPEFWEYGARIDQYPAADGASFRKSGTCLVIYSEKADPSQERSAREIARFSPKDAEQWLKLWNLWNTDAIQRVQMDMIFNPAALRNRPEVLERQMAVYGPLAGAGFEPDSLVLTASALRAVREFWESPELQYCLTRFALTAIMDVNEPGTGADAFGIAATLPTLGFARGGTHQIAHAAHQLLTQMGCKLFTHAHVEKVSIENGKAVGIRLSDGSVIAARRIVVSTLNPRQLCFELVGREHWGSRVIRRIELLESKFSCYMDYVFALNEAPSYLSASFNPDVNRCYWLGLAEDPDPEHVARECHYQRLGIQPPLADWNPVIWCHSLADPSYAPHGKHIAVHEQLGPPATAHTETEWMTIKEQYLRELVELWHRHAPNITWENIIGVHANTPHDNLRMKNFGPDGSNAIIDCPPYQRYQNRPIPELADHRTPIANLYATGAAWHPGGNASSAEAYNCYKIIATDLGLGKPWEESGKEEPDSLVEQVKAIKAQIRDAGQ